MTPASDSEPTSEPDSERAVSERAVSERAAVQGSGPGVEAECDADAHSTVLADARSGVRTEAQAAARTHAVVDPDPGPDLDPEVDPEVDGRLRAAFAEAAHDITPNPVPLAAVRRQGRAHRRRRAVTLAALAVLSVSGAATVARLSLPADHAVTLTPPVPSTPPASLPPRPPAAAAPGRADAPQVTEVRVVRSGERVDAGKGWTVWLTAEGKHWTGPDGYENSRSVTDGNVDTAAPGVSYQSEGDGKGVFHSGLYYGTRSVGRVELRGADGPTVLATLLELPGRPGWGVWYAYTPVTAAPGAQDPGTADLYLYDRSGRRLADLPGTHGNR
ncbi:hypothetical protein [Streptomyces sp. NPDC101115]|uniref:hypothetical protein n=1 Tax=Streptomyces sp. NPDC101115 TaxID=3366106 RepID=UPI00380F0DEA